MTPTINSFQIIAHRGDSAHAPGNTAEAFQKAIAAGAPLIETDVRLTADGILIIEHDEDTGGLLVSEATLAELRSINPALLTVAQTVRDFGQIIPFCWEVKAPGIIPMLTTLVRDLIPSALWAKTQWTSFIWKNVVALQQAVPECTIGWLTADWDDSVIARVAQAGLRQICPPAAKILGAPDLIKIAHDLHVQVRAWSISNVALVPQLAAIGVDGGTVNFPGEALEALTR